jgi:hypothetical protein
VKLTNSLNVMSDSDFGAVTRYANNLDIIDNDWMQDEISEAEVGDRSSVASIGMHTALEMQGR